jgi:hypothetical protein
MTQPLRQSTESLSSEPTVNPINQPTSYPSVSSQDPSGKPGKLTTLPSRQSTSSLTIIEPIVNPTSQQPASSHAASSYSTSQSYSSYATPVIPAPSYSPFYSPFSFGFGYSPFYSPFSFGFFNPNLFLLGAMAYIAYQVLKNRIGGSDFASEDMSGDSGYLGSLGAGATVINLQV